MKNSDIFEDILINKAREIEKEIRLFFPKPTMPKLMNESMEYSLFSEGKRIRAMLIKECAEIVKADKNSALALMAGVEMIHAYSLIHDDLPCMDNDELRRGKPSCHIKFGYAQALLAGDGLLNLAYETMLNYFPKAINKEKYIKSVSVIAQAAGVEGMILGQCADILNERNVLTEKELSFINEHKTGALIRACCVAGAGLGDITDKQAEAFSLYGKALGELFQLTDDLLDIFGDEAVTGKPVGSDKRKEKITYASQFGEQKTRQRIEYLYENCIESTKYCGEKTDFLCELAFYLKGRSK